MIVFLTCLLTQAKFEMVDKTWLTSTMPRKQLIFVFAYYSHIILIPLSRSEFDFLIMSSYSLL